jgi:hypothetical protein
MTDTGQNSATLCTTHKDFTIYRFPQHGQILRAFLRGLFILTKNAKILKLCLISLNSDIIDIVCCKV